MSYEVDSAAVVKCVLRCLEGRNMDIELPDQETVTLGRGPLTKIIDKRCSRHQLEACADYNKQVVLVKQLGANASEVCEQELRRNDETVLREGDTVNILAGRYGYLVHFIFSGSDSGDNSKDDASVSVSNKQAKRKTDSNDQIASKRTKQDLNKNPKTTDNTDENEKYKQQNVVEKLEEMKKNMTSKSSESKLSTKVDFKLMGSNKCFGWENVDKLLVFTSKGVEGRNKIACFDFDGTIIVTKSGKVFPQNDDDYKIMDSIIPKKLRDLYEDGYKIVFMTNQNGIAKGKVDVNKFKRKIETVVETINLPIQVFVAVGSGIYRKPAIGMWQHLIEKANDGVSVDIGKSLYCGDAAGREAKWAPGKKKDFSMSDRLFALNLNIEFHTPEELFLGYKKAEFKLPSFNPISLNEDGPLCNPVDAKLTSKTQEMIILVGYPAAGKTFFAKKYLVPHDYVYVNRDTLGAWQKCISLCEKSLNQKKNVVVDNTNPDLESRKRYIDCARNAGVDCRCFFFALSFEHAMHNNKFRELFGPDKGKAVTDIIMFATRTKMVEPKCSEGFSEVILINFVPKFQDATLEKSYKMFLIGK